MYKARFFSIILLLVSLAMVSVADATRCDEVVAKQSHYEVTRINLFRSTLMANMRIPQTFTFININLFSQFIKSSASMKSLLEPLQQTELDSLTQAMDKAHAAYGINANSTGNGLGTKHIAPSELVRIDAKPRDIVANAVVALLLRLQPNDQLLIQLKVALKAMTPDNYEQLDFLFDTFLRSPDYARERQILRQIQLAFEEVFRSTEFDSLARMWRENIRATGKSPPPATRIALNSQIKSLLKKSLAQIPELHNRYTGEDLAASLIQNLSGH